MYLNQLRVSLEVSSIPYGVHLTHLKISYTCLKTCCQTLKHFDNVISTCFSQTILTISLRRVHAQNNHFVFNVETSGIEVRNIRLVYRITSI